MSQAQSRPVRARQESIPNAALSSGQSLGANVATNSSNNYSRSPVRSQPTSTQRLRTPVGAAGSSNSSVNGQRRSSFANIGDYSSDFTPNLGIMPAYSYTGLSSSHNQGGGSPNNGSNSSLNNNFSILPSSSSLASAASTSTISTRTPILRTVLPQSSKGSPRGSPKNSITYLDISGNDSQRRFSESSARRPSTEEVFDLMEREQDAIVLKLMREISQLKEENRALLSTINSMQSPSSFAHVSASKRASISGRNSFDLQTKNASPTTSNFSSVNGSNVSNYTHTSNLSTGSFGPLDEQPHRHHCHQHHRRQSSLNDNSNGVVPRTVHSFDFNSAEDTTNLNTATMKMKTTSINVTETE
ncbi:hypothetical protein WICPIJ_004727 [Wickerhamomyces pijperi]|uniref:Uncharacterized protein n=1 Tax=Wickerhamomyces pijperi TaxID=599730 RepID=A0A9P8Q4U3_WICPI|nr:hypothetical protein WICPIJ_004727 [Wickerhamomyces pijperi]